MLEAAETPVQVLGQELVVLTWYVTPLLQMHNELVSREMLEPACQLTRMGFEVTSTRKPTTNTVL